MTFNLKKTN